MLTRACSPFPLKHAQPPSSPFSTLPPREMSIITPSRVELLPIHDPFFGPLQPSAMPAPPSTISPRLTTASFAVPLPPKLDRSCLDQLGASQYNSVTSWRKAMDGVPRATPSGRLILGEVRPNSNPSASTTSRSTSNPLTRISAANSIPRPAPAPDVFAPSLKVSFQSRPTTTSTLSSKRTRDPGSGGLSSLKRVKVEDKRELVKATAEIHKAEEERWRAKWVKVFPTLVFHLEIGAEEGQGRSLSGRVVRMGAVSDRSRALTRGMTDVGLRKSTSSSPLV